MCYVSIMLKYFIAYYQEVFNWWLVTNDELFEIVIIFLSTSRNFFVSE